MVEEHAQPGARADVDQADLRRPQRAGNQGDGGHVAGAAEHLVGLDGAAADQRGDLVAVSEGELAEERIRLLGRARILGQVGVERGQRLGGRGDQQMTHRREQEHRRQLVPGDAGGEREHLVVVEQLAGDRGVEGRARGEVVLREVGEHHPAHLDAVVGGGIHREAG